MKNLDESPVQCAAKIVGGRVRERDCGARQDSGVSTTRVVGRPFCSCLNMSTHRLSLRGQGPVAFLHIIGVQALHRNAN